ncbi:beta-propeller domain-containing protein [Aquipuribacter nitratireducens]|uniref:Beta-propeller domain-containing protein n=1 Tax=Aquipuribacter nitratireducens TaxID=650104 RepID=A0ABW0GMY6_9MICO
MDEHTATPRTARRRRGARLAAGLTAALAVAAGVAVVDVARAPEAAAAGLEPFGSCEELLGWYRDTALAHTGPYGLGGPGDDSVGGGVAVMEDSAAAAPAADGAARTGDAVGTSGTGTNVQEEGVDEPAPLKLLGSGSDLAVTVVGEELVVVDTAAGAVVGRVRLAPAADPASHGGTGAGGTGGLDDAASDMVFPAPGRWFGDLLVVGDHVVVLGSASLPVPVEDGPATGGVAGGASVDLMPWPGSVTTTATVVDVADPRSPRVVDTVEVEGSTVSARAADGVVRLVVTSTPVLRTTDPWTVAQDPDAPAAARATGPDGSVPPEAEAEAERRNRAIVETADLSTWLPDLVERGDDGTAALSPLPCDAVHHPSGDAGLGTVAVLTLDPAAEDPLSATTAVSADGSYVYASTDRLYVATTRGGWLWGGPVPFGVAVDDTETAAPRVTTELHGFDTSERGDVTYLGSGEVDGWLLGQWAMDAHEGRLRVGTTLDGGEAGTSSSVVVLEEDGTRLVEVGRVDGLGPGEQIRSLRWFDDLAVVVTFRQTDPLYTVDLADPTDPRVLGELKVTGYSGYLHPVGDGLLLGVGQEGDAEGVLSGAKAETYDVRDLADPTDVDRLVWPDATSSVEQDSRRFAYLPDLRTALVPLDRTSAVGWSSGLVAVRVATDGTLAETGEWVLGQDGWVHGLASSGDRVVVSGERWPGADEGRPVEGPERTLTVLDAVSLTPLVEVVL